jgi:hypothetical protein
MSEVCSETVLVGCRRSVPLSVCPLRENRKICAGEERKGRIVGSRLIKTIMLEWKQGK